MSWYDRKDAECVRRYEAWEEQYKETPRSSQRGHACISHLRGYNCAWHYHMEADGWREYVQSVDPLHGHYNPNRWHHSPRIIADPRPCRFPFADHSSMWKDRKTGELVYVTQPYGMTNIPGKPFGDADIEEMNAFCAEYGLKWEIDARKSWHFPGETTFIMVTRDKNSKVPFGKRFVT